MTQSNLSVVIASGSGGPFLFRCLDSLERQARSHQAQVVVVDRCGESVRRRLREKHQWVTLIETDSARRLSIPELRLLGVKNVTGRIVAIIEEHCVAPGDWIETILRNFKEGDAAIGGPILDNGYQRLRDWVVYFSEYHNYLPPWKEGERFDLNGANIAYDRVRLLKHEQLLATGYWEVVAHPLLAGEGRFRAVPGMGVYHTGPFDYGYYLEQRYLLSRVWGGAQRNRVNPLKRLIYLVVAPVFPFFLLMRMGARVVSSGHKIGKYLESLPLLFPVTVAYVCGEWLGYAAGTGDTLRRVE